MSQKAPLNVGIVGGGIAGLSAAIALKRAGHKVEVFEKRDFSNEFGISLVIGPNANHVFNSWGFNLETECAGVEGRQVRHVAAATAQVIWKDSWADLQERYGAKVTFLRYRDIHTGLRTFLDSTEGFPAFMVVQTEVVDVNCEAGTIHLADGSVSEKDLVVLANGLNGKFIEDITGIPCPLQDTGLSFFRFIAKNRDILDDDEAGLLFKDEPDDLTLFLRPDGASIVTYPLQSSNSRVVNVFAPRLSSETDKRDRNAKISIDQLLGVAKGFHPNIQAILKKAPEDGIFVYPLNIRDPIRKYVHGRAVMIGDAAHVVKPQQGQGASISIESAGCLEVLFKDVGRDEVQSRLEVFEKLRLPRCGPVHVFSNMPLSPDGHAWMTEKIQPFWDHSKTLPPPGSRPLSLPFREFLYSFNVINETEKSVAKYEKRHAVNGNGVA